MSLTKMKDVRSGNKITTNPPEITDKTAKKLSMSTIYQIWTVYGERTWYSTEEINKKEKSLGPQINTS